ncbi:MULTISPECIES: hypothetical protein [Haloferax]|uniref:Uncharacterized protein n=1 Tax=Haloferax volcanii TaxID=2246 RepID=A0A6C0UX03_HALVO|nr:MULTISPECIES: hypothetical protein [Haloferax]QIB78921.1 hypothetical protein G3A49_12560 [Haloferax alexandrinus]RDZ35432.1 hypothetical protein C5B88_13650 [Haloferax sp. Atlit-24N]RLM35843.1 hypothetical protein DVK03_13660 [Haloferax sp. Atlit-109R]RLM43692.1 hypothetical protein DVK04_13660 [Haloferax sp. Atlit-105R]WEL30028.1 hypothetical protein HBNXHx_1926 [Haloferax alexandrinus]
MTERSAHDDPADDAEAAGDADTRVDDAPFEHASADVAPELFPAEPTAADAGTGGTPGRPDSDSATSS